MKTWLRGNRWEVQPGKVLNRFQIRSDKFDENELILPLHLTAEGFPTLWGPAHAFTIRLNHSGLRLEEKDAAYREQCRQAARDLLTLVVAQFLGFLRPDEIPLRENTQGAPPASRLFGLLQGNLESESRRMPALVMLRDPRLSGSPIAAFNYPDCLWFPVHSYKLDMVRQRIAEILGLIEVDRLTPSQRNETEVRALVSQLRAYLRQFFTAGMDTAYARVLGRFEHGLSSVAETGVVPIRSGRAFGLSGTDVQEIELRRSGDVTFPLESGCPKCGHDWMNHRYRNGPLVLKGGSHPTRKVICPQDGTELIGWDDLMSRGVFYDEEEHEYVFWIDDPTDEGAQDLQLPPNSERLEAKRNPDGQGEVSFRFNQAEIIVRGRGLKRSEVLLKQVVELPRTATVRPLPLNGEEAVCVDWEAGGIAEEDSRKGYWNVRLRGGWRPFVWHADAFKDSVLSEPDNVTLLLWPGFEDPKWQTEAVVYGVSTSLGSPPRVRCYGAGPRKQRMLGEVSGVDIAHCTLDVVHRIEALEFRSSSNEPLGFLRPKRQPLFAGQVNQAILALDFGTSNTALCWTSSIGQPKEVAMDQEALPLELLAPSDPDRKGEIAKGLSLLPFWPKLIFSRWCIPSELLFFKESGRWTIPHDSLDPANLEKDDIRRNFKWRDDDNVHRSIYLGMLLRMALAALRAQGIHSVELRATYPLAFEPGHLGGYDLVLQKLIEQLAEETGMGISLKGYVNESISGLQSCGQQSGNLHCVIDFGGGTTDIAIRVIDPLKGFVEPLFVDSIRLAGSDVIESLLADPVLLDGILKHGKAVLSSSSPAEVRQKVARQIVLGELRSSVSGLPPWWRDLITGSQREQGDAAQLFAMRNRAFFDGVLGYVLKLIAVAEQEMRRNKALREDQGARVDIFLLGQGWGLLRLQVGRGEHNPQAYVRSRLEELRAALPFAPPKCAFEVYLPGYEVRHALKLATSHGAALLPPSDVRPAADLESKTGRQTIFGFEMQFTDGNRLGEDDFLEEIKEKSAIRGGLERSGAWDQFAGPLLNAPGVADHVRQLFGPNDTERRKYVESRVSFLISKEFRDQLAKNVPPRTSPLLLFLEQIWAEQLKRLGSG